jgi:hypothetical protein
VAETWFTPEYAPGLVGYDLHRWDRPTRGGGVAIYVRDDLVSIKVSNEALKGGLVEQVWCGVTVGSDRILVGCVYRPPGLDIGVDDGIIRAIKEAKVLIRSGKFDIAGDFNMPDIEWSTEGIGSSPRLGSTSESFLLTLEENFISQCINEPTFHKDESGSGSILDLILTDEDERVLDVSYAPPLGKIQMAHAVISWKVAVGGSSEVVFRPKIKWNKGRYEDMSRDLREINWREIFDSKELDCVINMCL